MKDLIACCGIDCEFCDARIATVNNDYELREQTARKWSEMNHAPEITPETINCMSMFSGNYSDFRGIYQSFSIDVPAEFLESPKPCSCQSA